MDEIKDSLIGFSKKTMPGGDPKITNELIGSIVDLCSPQNDEEA